MSRERIDWPYWRRKKMVPAWAAVYLSLHMEPSNHDLREQVNWPERPEQEAVNRIDLLLEYSSDTQWFSPPVLSLSDRRYTQVILSEFAYWAKHCMQWKKLPPQLLAMARRPDAHEDVPDTATETEAGLTKREQQIRAIEKEVTGLGFKAKLIPLGGKKKVLSICKKNHSNLFGGGDDPFMEAWQEAVSQGRIRTANHDKYAKK